MKKYAVIFFLLLVAGKGSVSQEQEIIEMLKKDVKALEATRIMINDILKQIQQFIVIIQSSPGISQQIEKWGRSKKITHWPNKAKWESFNRDLQELVRNLTLINEQDPQSKEYKYLAYVIENKDLFDKLIHLQKELNSLVPIIVIPKIEKEKIKEKSKKAIQDTVNQLAVILYKGNIRKQLNEIFKTYEPTAEKLKEEAQVAQERALEGGVEQAGEYY